MTRLGSKNKLITKFRDGLPLRYLPMIMKIMKKVKLYSIITLVWDATI